MTNTVGICDVLTVVKFPTKYGVVISYEPYKESRNRVVLYECGIETMEEFELVSRLAEEANKTGRKLAPSDIEAALLAA
jgi:hypothetical protein